ncbi:MAG: RES family NAD+ phosphorylase [Casimicrobium sp.]
MPTWIESLNIAELHPNGPFSTLYRIQFSSPRAGSLLVNDHILARNIAAERVGRFDPKAGAVAYFTLNDHTALYETLCRRDQKFLAVEDALARSLIEVKLTERLRLVDARESANDFPALVSIRFDVSQAIADSAIERDCDGVLYTSAQHPGHSCIALFGDAIESLIATKITPLAIKQASGGKSTRKKKVRFHPVLVDAMQRADLKFAP